MKSLPGFWLDTNLETTLPMEMKMCSCDYEMPEMYNAFIHTARKEHVCEECGRRILAGERYETVAGKWDGEFFTFKTCSHCLDLKNFVNENTACFCWAHGNIREDAMETARCVRTLGLLFGVWRREIVICRAKANHSNV